MGETEMLGALAQFGAAGLIGWMWLSERRSASVRERQLAEAHERIMQERAQFAALIDVVNANTRALTAMESGQRALGELIGCVITDRAEPDTRRGDAA